MYHLSYDLLIVPLALPPRRAQLALPPADRRARRGKHGGRLAHLRSLRLLAGVRHLGHERDQVARQPHARAPEVIVDLAGLRDELLVARRRAAEDQVQRPVEQDA
eukprot:546602-Pyramimonas_sp.AAC.2